MTRPTTLTSVNRSVLFWDITQRRVVITTRRCVISQKSAGPINIAAEA
jgi:hypothetical protein